MSKSSKAAAREKRKQSKFARKRAKKALYASYAEKGANKKSKRFLKKGLKKLAKGIKHAFTGKCGNPGCKKCYGIYFGAFLKKGKPHRMPHWMYLAWCKENA